MTIVEVIPAEESKVGHCSCDRATANPLMTNIFTRQYPLNQTRWLVMDPTHKPTVELWSMLLWKPQCLHPSNCIVSFSPRFCAAQEKGVCRPRSRSARPCIQEQAPHRACIWSEHQTIVCVDFSRTKGTAQLERPVSGRMCVLEELVFSSSAGPTVVCRREQYSEGS